MKFSNVNEYRRPSYCPVFKNDLSKKQKKKSEGARTKTKVSALSVCPSCTVYTVVDILRRRLKNLPLLMTLFVSFPVSGPFLRITTRPRRTCTGTLKTCK